MATHQSLITKAGKKRKRNESAALSTKPVKKVKAAGAELQQLGVRNAASQKETASLSDDIPNDDHNVRSRERIRPKIKNRSHSDAGKEVRRDLKKQQKREKRRTKKTSEWQRSIEKTQGQDEDVLSATADRPSSSQKWSSSIPSGGTFLPSDPIFLEDGEGKQLLVCATGREVYLISMSDSAVMRSYSAPIGQSIQCFAVDAVDQNLVHIVHHDGTTSSWDWASNSSKTRKSEANRQIVDVTSFAKERSDTSSLFYLCNVGERFTVVNQGETLYTTQQRLESVRVAGKGEYIACRGPSVLVLGTRRAESLPQYIWVELPLVSNATCLDVRVTPRNKGSGKASKQHSGLSVAVGFENGRIELHSDLSPCFDQGIDSRELPAPRVLHWHRQAVAAVKFSPDGNYLISGGTETVLVLWQLETGKKQYSPHLKAAIDRIVINTDGNRYALQMGDHSIMVLNSADFKAISYFSNLQATSPADYAGNASVLPRMSAALHPGDSSQLLISVPSTQPLGDRDVVGRPFLQTYDTFRSSHVRLQALQRNFTTEVNVAPNGSSLVPPDVVHLAISHDGAWLATVDEWTPERADLQHLTADSRALNEEVQKRREVHLRIWHWEQAQTAWVENYTRENPHARINGDALGAGRVLSLESEPGTSSFATIGEDGIVKIWSRGRTKQNDLPKWRCQHSVELPYARSPFNMLDESMPFDGSAWHLAYSNDGSLLSVAYSKPPMATSGAPNEMYFINTRSGRIHSSKSGRTGGDVRGLAFLGRYYITLSSEAVYVWDFVDDRLMYKAKIRPGRSDATYANLMLASDEESFTFAVVIGNKVVIYDPRETKRLYKQEFENDIQTVLTSRASLGYTIILNDNAICTASELWTSHLDVPPSERATPALELQLDVASDQDEDLSTELVASVRENGVTRQDDGALDGDDRPVVTPAQLADICDSKADGTLPSVYDMFWGVVRVCARKPLLKA